ncbi:MAG: TonB-dependent receptor [Pseudomonadota bacterium]
MDSMPRSPLPITPLIPLLVAASVGAPAWGQLEEVLVTAQKREQSIQDVGIAVSALSGDQIRQLGLGNAQQITALAPGVGTVQPNGEANYAIAIRGVANSDFTTNVESPVAIYLDEVYVSQMSGAGFMLFDMERVEILRGPQGTLFGRNATGGLAHFITVKPSLDAFDGYVQASGGSFDQFKLEGAVGGPLSEKVAFRASAALHYNDGYVDNRFLGETLNNANDEAGRFQLLIAPSDTVEVLLNVRGGQQDIRTGFFENVTSLEFGTLTPGEPNPVLDGYFDPDRNDDVFAGDYDRPGFNVLDTFGATATITIGLTDSIELTSITDYQTVERDYIEDSDASPVPLFNFFLTTDAEQFSQELRLSGGAERVRWTAGAYYLDLDINDSNGAETEPFIDPVSDTPALSGLDNPYTTTTESISLFAQMEYDLTPSTTAIAGVRWVQDDKAHDYSINAVDFVPGTVQRNGNPNILETIGTYEGERDDSIWAARLALEARPADGVLLYGSYNRGVKGGGFNSPIFPVATFDDATFSYAPEELDAFELGFKADLPGGLVRVNGAAYYYNYDNYQAFTIVGIDTITQNADAQSRGFELELQSNPAEGLSFLAGIAYNDIEVDLGAGLPQTTSVQSPEWNFNALARYERQVFANGGSLALQTDMQWRSEHFFALTGLETVTENGYAVWNAAMSYTSPDGAWVATAFVENLTDEEYLVQTFDLSGTDVFGLTEQYYGRPRWVGVRLARYWR